MSYRNFLVIGWLGVLYLREKNSQYLTFLLQISDVYLYFVLKMTGFIDQKNIVKGFHLKSELFEMNPLKAFPFPHP